jgi:hypothetical protein
MPARNSDGTIRNARSPKKLTERSVRARWVEAEVLRLKRFGLSFSAAAEQITAVGRGKAQAMVAIPPGLIFPKNYHLGHSAAQLAYQVAVNREPSLEVAELRRLDNDRTEDYLVALQPEIRKGSARSIDTAVRIHEHKAKINGYLAPETLEVKAVGAAEFSAEEFNRMRARLTHEEWAVFFGLWNKATGRVPVERLVIEVQATRLEGPQRNGKVN